MSKQTKPSIVFCHGIWADGSCLKPSTPANELLRHSPLVS